MLIPTDMQSHLVVRIGCQGNALQDRQGAYQQRVVRRDAEVELHAGMHRQQARLSKKHAVEMDAEVRMNVIVAKPATCT
eukprot:scaffold45764_cov20-Tisochrysis_lutea.AAC.3